MDLRKQTKEIAPSVAIFAIIVIAAIAGSVVYEEYLESNRETELPAAVDFGDAETQQEAELRREIRSIEIELEQLSAEIIEGSGFGLWNLEQEVNAITEEAIQELEL